MRAILITAGATRNPIDAMRYISANSTGRTGAWIASRLAGGADVTLLGSPEAISRVDSSVAAEPYTSTEDLMAKMKAWVDAHPDGLVVHAAAVGDYAVAADHQDKKIASGQTDLLLTLVPTPKILDSIRQWSGTAKIISFKAAGPGTDRDSLMHLAQGQAERSDSALVFANTIGRLDTDVFVWGVDGGRWFATRETALEALVETIKSIIAD